MKKKQQFRKPDGRVIGQDDILLIDFGSNGRVNGTHPALVMSRRACDGKTNQWMVVPLYRKENYSSFVPDVVIRPADCQRLHADMYAQVTLMRSVCYGQIRRRIGHMRNQSVHTELERLLWEQIGKGGEAW